MAEPSGQLWAVGLGREAELPRPPWGWVTEHSEGTASRQQHPALP